MIMSEFFNFGHPERDVMMEKREKAIKDGKYIKIMEEDNPVFSTSDFNSQRIAILGASGSGKSNTFARIFEQTLEKGIGCTIVDLEGEFFTLGQKFEILKIGKNKHCDMDISPEGAPVIATRALEDNLPILLDFSNHSDIDRFSFMEKYFKTLFEHAQDIRKPHLIGVDEAVDYFPESGFSQKSYAGATRDIMELIARRGRKRGLGLVFCAQRSAIISKDVLTQANVQFLHYVSHPQDTEVYKGLIGDSFGTARDLKRKIDSMRAGECFVYVKENRSSGGKWYNGKVLERDTVDAGFTPDINFNPISLPDLKKIQDKMIQSIRNDADSYNDPSQDPTKRYFSLEKKYMELEDDFTRLREINMAQAKEIKTLSSIKVEITRGAMKEMGRVIGKSIKGLPIDEDEDE
jgi:hypothetical protein